MKWITLAAAIVAIVFAVRILLADLARGRGRSTLGQLALAVLSLALLGAAVYTAHWLGLFSVPIVAFAFVPFGLAARWWFLSGREKRALLEASRPPATRTERLLAIARWPIFLALIALVVTAGVVAGLLAAKY
jgi:hypothetical protein